MTEKTLIQETHKMGLQKKEKKKKKEMRQLQKKKKSSPINRYLCLNILQILSKKWL